MMQVLTSKGMQTLPRVGSYWKHRNGNIYQVTKVTNLSDRQDEYPVTVSYIGPNGKEWSKQAFNWFTKMRPLTDVLVEWLNNNEGQILTRDKISELAQIWLGMMQQAGDGDPKE
jgi:hypothetical protein